MDYTVVYSCYYGEDIVGICIKLYGYVQISHVALLK